MVHLIMFAHAVIGGKATDYRHNYTKHALVITVGDTNSNDEYNGTAISLSDLFDDFSDDYDGLLFQLKS
jgi:hypothetical protein